jgi:hypothetical protein
VPQKSDAVFVSKYFNAMLDTDTSKFKCGLQDLNERVCNYSSKFSKKMAFLGDNLRKQTEKIIIMYRSAFTDKLYINYSVRRTL